MNVQVTFGSSMTPIRVRGEEGAFTDYIPKSLTHDVLRSSHPFTGWTSLVTLSEDGSAMKFN